MKNIQQERDTIWKKNTNGNLKHNLKERIQLYVHCNISFFGVKNLIIFFHEQNIFFMIDKTNSEGCVYRFAYFICIFS